MTDTTSTHPAPATDPRFHRRDGARPRLPADGPRDRRGRRAHVLVERPRAARQPRAQGAAHKDPTKPRAMALAEPRADGVDRAAARPHRGRRARPGRRARRGPHHGARGLRPATRDHFALRVAGDSMIGAGIFDGDIVVIRSQRSRDATATSSPRSCPARPRTRRPSSGSATTAPGSCSSRRTRRWSRSRCPTGASWARSSPSCASSDPGRSGLAAVDRVARIGGAGVGASLASHEVVAGSVHGVDRVVANPIHAADRRPCLRRPMSLPWPAETRSLPWLAVDGVVALRPTHRCRPAGHLA